MAAPVHLPFRLGSLSSSLDEEKKGPVQRMRELHFSEKKQLPNSPQKQPRCYKPFATKAPFLLLIAGFALGVFITVERMAHHYPDYNTVKNIPLPRVPGLSTEEYVAYRDWLQGTGPALEKRDEEGLHLNKAFSGDGLGDPIPREDRLDTNDGLGGSHAIGPLDPAFVRDRLHTALLRDGPELPHGPKLPYGPWTPHGPKEPHMPRSPDHPLQNARSNLGWNIRDFRVAHGDRFLRSPNADLKDKDLKKRDADPGPAYDPTLGVLGIFTGDKYAFNELRRKHIKADFFRRHRKMSRRDAKPDDSLVVEIDIMPDVSEQEEADGCSRSLINGRKTSCHRVSNSHRFLLPPRDVTHDSLTKRQAGAASSEDSGADDSATSDAPDGGNGAANASEDMSDQVYDDFSEYQLTPEQYFVAYYLLILLSFIIRVLWICAYNSIRLMEPFYALANPKGATAEHALSCMYLHDSLLPEPIRALRGRQWMMFVAGITSVLVALLPAFSLGVLQLNDTHCVKAMIPDQAHPCAQGIFNRLPILRIFETILILIVITVTGFAAANTYRSSGVYSDPSSIATLTSLLHHPTMVDRLRRIDDSTTDEEIDEIFEDDRYRIGGYRTFDMTTRYGIVPVGKTGWVSRSATQDSIDSLEKTRARNAARQLAPRAPRKKWQKIAIKLHTEISLGFMLLALLALLVTYYNDLNDDAFNAFFNAEGTRWQFWPRFVFTVMGTFCASAWRRIECQNRTQAPYQDLRKPGPATPLLTPTTSSAWTSLPYALFRRQWLVVLSASNAIVAEVNLIALSGVPFSPLMYYYANLYHQYISMAFVSFMLLSLIVHVFNRLRNQSFMPREPDTILGALSYVAASEMVEDFEGLALNCTQTRARRVQSWGKQYQFAEQICVDGVQRLALDEVAANRGGPEMVGDKTKGGIYSHA